MQPNKKDATNQEFLSRLREVIKKIGGNKESARIMRKSVKSVERYKNGAEMPMDAVYRLVKAANFSIDWLITGEGSPDGKEEVKKNYLSKEYISKYMVQLDDVKDAVEALFEHLNKNKKKITPEKAGQLIVLMLQISVDEDRENADDTNLVRLLDLATD